MKIIVLILLFENSYAPATLSPGEKTLGTLEQLNSQHEQMYSSPKSPEGSEVHPAPYQWVSAALSPCIKRLGRNADHSPPSSIELRVLGAIAPFLSMPYLLHGVLHTVMTAV